MKKELILERMDKTIEMLKSITPEMFRYDSWVTQFDPNSGCGTVCCVGGWYPKFIPEVGLTWYEGDLIAVEETDMLSSSMVMYTLKKWHGMNWSLTKHLFTGSILFNPNGTEYLYDGISFRSSLEDVLKAWVTIRDRIANTPDLDWCLNLGEEDDIAL